MTEQEQIEETVVCRQNCLHYAVCLRYVACLLYNNDMCTPLNCNYFENKNSYRKQVEGEWIIQGLANPKCSACNHYTRGGCSKFCPECGAKMKGD